MFNRYLLQEWTHMKMRPKHFSWFQKQLSIGFLWVVLTLLMVGRDGKSLHLSVSISLCLSDTPLFTFHSLLFQSPLHHLPSEHTYQNSSINHNSLLLPSPTPRLSSGLTFVYLPLISVPPHADCCSEPPLPTSLP